MLWQWRCGVDGCCGLQGYGNGCEAMNAVAMEAVTMAEMEDVAMAVEMMAMDVEAATMMAIIIKIILK